MNYFYLITIEPGKRSGKCIRGLHMTVRDVLDYLAGGMTVDKILADFPRRTTSRHCLAFAADRERRLWVVSAANSCSTRTCPTGGSAN